MEDCKALDVRYLYRHGMLASLCWSNLSWSRAGGPVGNISLRADPERVILNYRYRRYHDDWQPVEQPVPLAWTSCHYGGQRPWFICPGVVNGRYCGRQVAVLYAAGRYFLCRHCYRLPYASQNESDLDRLQRRARKLRRRVGADDRLDDPILGKPKGMHWRTFERLRAEAEAASEVANVMIWEKLAVLTKMRRRQVMATLMQIEANRANALNSTGPKTGGGKRRVSQNALKHGLLSRRLVLEDESPEEFQALVDDLHSALYPAGTLEFTLVEKVALAFWRQRRLIRAESAGIELQRRMDRHSNRDKIEAALGMTGYRDGEVSEQDLVSPDEDDKAQAAWCTQVIAEFDALDQGVLRIRNDMTPLSDKAPLIFSQLQRDAEEEDQSMVAYIAKYPGGLAAYTAGLIAWCRNEITKLERRPTIQAVAELVKSSLSAPIEQDLLSRYQAALDNELYRALKALREAQQWRLQSLDAVPEASESTG